MPALMPAGSSVSGQTRVHPLASVQVIFPPASDVRMYSVRPLPLTRTVPTPGTLAVFTVTSALGLDEEPVDVGVDFPHAANVNAAAAARQPPMIHPRLRPVPPRRTTVVSFLEFRPTRSGIDPQYYGHRRAGDSAPKHGSKPTGRPTGRILAPCPPMPPPPHPPLPATRCTSARRSRGPGLAALAGCSAGSSGCRSLRSTGSG